MGEELTTDEVMEELNPDMNDVADFAMVEVAESPEEEEKEVIEEKKEEEEVKADSEEKPKEEIEEKEEPTKLDLEKKEAKSFKIDTGDKEAVEIAADAKITIKVDGESKEFTLQELANHKSGEVAYDKKFSELGNAKKEFAVEKSTFNEESQQLMAQVTSFVESVQKQNAGGAIEALAGLCGENPIELRQYFLDLMRENSIAYEKMSEEQKKELDNSRKMEYLEERDQRREQDYQDRQAHSDMTNQVIQFQNKLGIDDAKLVSLKDELEEKSIPLSLEALEKLHIDGSSQDKASSILTQVDPSLSDNDGYVAEIKDFIQKNPDLSDEDLVDCIKTAVAEQKQAKEDKEESASNKMKSRVKKSNPNKSSSNSQSFESDAEDDITDFDEVSHQF